MLKKSKQIKYCKLKFESVNNHFRNFLQSGDSGELHQMRIEIKRIKALLSLSNFCMKKLRFPVRIKKINELFKAAGLIRSTNISLQVIDNINLNNSDQAELKNTYLNLLEHHFRDFFTNKDIYKRNIKHSGNKIVKNLGNINVKCIKKFYRNNLCKLLELFSLEKPEKNFHQCRKMIKDLVYSYELFSEGTKNKIGLNLNYLINIEDSIGKWHDELLAVKILKKEKTQSEQIKILEEKSEKHFTMVNSLSENFLSKCLLKNNKWKIIKKKSKIKNFQTQIIR